MLSKSLWFLGLCPKPHWGSLQCPPQEPSREGLLLAFRNRSFAPSVLAICSTNSASRSQFFPSRPPLLNSWLRHRILPLWSSRIRDICVICVPPFLCLRTLCPHNIKKPEIFPISVPSKLYTDLCLWAYLTKVISSGTLSSALSHI